MSEDSAKIIFDLIAANELEDAVKIEQEGYPADEAASLEAFRLRQSAATDLFLGAYQPDSSGHRELIGYVCSTLSPVDILTHESMSKHVPDSSYVCIHSVCVAASHRRKGVGLKLLREYINRLQAARAERPVPYTRALLITHEELRPFYEKAGFKWVGESEVAHGSRPWFAMQKDLAPSNSIVSPDTISQLPPAQVHSKGEQLPPGLWEALQRPQRNRPISKPLSSFAGGLADVITPSAEEGKSTNKYDLLCPRLACGSIILKAHAGKWVERSSVQLEPAELPSNPLLPSLPSPPETTQWWLVTPSPMVFENIGFSRPVQSHPTTGRKMKLLACAECDLGPLGWSEEGGSEFWLACARVSYKE